MVFGMKYAEINGNTEFSRPCHGELLSGGSKWTNPHRNGSNRKPSKPNLRALLLSITDRKISDLRLDPQNPRIHSKRQIKQIAQSIDSFGFLAPVLIDARGHLIAGHGRVLAAELPGMTHAPTIKLEHLTQAQIQAFTIADNRLTENSVWNERLLGEQLKALSILELDFSIEATGFEMSEIDIKIEGLESASREREESTDAMPESETKRQVTQADDVWVLNDGRVGWNNARGKAAHSISVQAQGNAAVLSDPRNVDKIVRLWQKSTRLDAVHQSTGQTFAQREREIANAKQK